MTHITRITRIDDPPSDRTLSLLAEAILNPHASDRTPGADEWTLSTGHGASHAQYRGTRQDVCAFLVGYSTMQAKATEMLRDLGERQQQLIDLMQRRLGSAPGSAPVPGTATLNSTLNSKEGA